MVHNEAGICERFKEIRLALKMNQSKFSKEIRTAQGHISDIENMRKGVSDRVLEIICLKFNVDEKWFLTGVGNMFIEKTDHEHIADLLEDIQNKGADSFQYRLISALSKLNKTEWETLEKITDAIAGK